MTVTLIWAQDRAGGIGQGNTIPWRVPEDMAHFKERTGTGAVIMGRKTWESLPSKFRPLPHRRNIVITRNADYDAPGAEICTSIVDALTRVGGTAAVIGGGEIYAAALPYATDLYVTQIGLTVDGADAFAPRIDAQDWRVAAQTDWAVSTTGTEYRFVDYVRA